MEPFLTRLQITGHFPKLLFIYCLLFFCGTYCHYKIILYILCIYLIYFLSPLNRMSEVFASTNCCMHGAQKSEWCRWDPEKFVKWMTFWERVSSRSNIDSPMQNVMHQTQHVGHGVEFVKKKKSFSNLTTSINLYALPGMRRRLQSCWGRAMIISGYLNKLPPRAKLKGGARSQRHYNHTDF